jgi:6-phosphofructokinase 1
MLANYDLRVIHVPKTIDNDLMLNDHTPGFGSAARFVTQAFMGINLDVRSLNGVYIGVVMGRHAGFLAASSAIARKYDADGPHLIYLPERVFSMEQFLQDVKEVYDRYGICIIAVSEGIKDASGVPMVTKLKEIEKDAHGNVQLSGNSSLGDLLADQIKRKLNIPRVRSDTFGSLQRSFFGCVSDIDQHEAREVGERAVQLAMWNDVDGSVTIRRTGNYSVDYQLDKLRTLQPRPELCRMNSSTRRDHVTDTFKFYVRPLLGSGLPQPSWVRAPQVPKILNNGS